MFFETEREIVISYDYYFFVLLTEWLKALADMWIFISGTKIGVKISQYYDFGWEQNRSLSFQFPKLYAIQMPGLLKSVVNFLKNKGIEKVWLVHKKSRKNRPPQQFIYQSRRRNSSVLSHSLSLVISQYSK